MSKLYVDKLCVSKWCVDKLCVAGGRQREEEAGGSAKPKTRTPHKDVGKNLRRPCACFFGFLHVHFVFNAAIFG